MIIRFLRVVPYAIFFLCSHIATAQYFFYNDKYYDQPVLFEFGIGGGAMNCFTDLGGNKGNGKPFIKDMNIENTRLCGSLFAGVVYKSVLAFRLQFTVGKVTAYDSLLKKVATNSGGRYERNLSFRSKILDMMIAAEFHPLYLGNVRDNPSRWSPYSLCGIGFFNFDPKANLNGEWHSLQPLRTEGQGFREYPERKPYKLLQVAIPLGVGVKYDISPILHTRLEVVHRILFTDYLDDVSTTYIDGDLFFQYLPANQATIANQLHDRRRELNPSFVGQPNDQRGDNKDKDAWFTIEIKFGVVLRKRRA